MESDYQILQVSEIQFDQDNPRIKKALEKYGDNITAERIHFALRSATDENDATGTFIRLRDSIRANGGITQPITIVEKDGKKTCIDGNTRLAIYKNFSETETDGLWSKIRALVLKNPEQRDVEAVRVSAHLVGARPWPAYEKARYLHYLYHKEFKDFNEMVALCGGNKKGIERQIQAYEDMNKYYRDVVDDSAFQIDRFSSFVEVQNDHVKQSIYDANFGMKDFGEWIHDGKIFKNADVRKLSRVLDSEKARGIFLNGKIDSIKSAIKYLDDQQEKRTQGTSNQTILDNVSIELLAKKLSQKINDLPFSELQKLEARKTNKDIILFQALEDLDQQLNTLLARLTDVGE